MVEAILSNWQDNVACIFWYDHWMPYRLVIYIWMMVLINSKKAHLYLRLLYEAIQDESAEVCFIFHNAHSMLLKI